MAYADVNGIQYRYETVGQGPPLVLLHGFTGSLENWAPFVSFFGRHHQTISIDLLGHGQTDAPVDEQRYRMEACAEDLAVLLQQLTAEPVNLLGYSMGGRLALFLALTRPLLINSVILESSSPGLNSELERTQRTANDRKMADEIERHGIESFVQHWQAISLFASQENLPAQVRDGLRQQRLRSRPTGLANSLRGMGTGMQPSLWSRLAGISFPLLILAGELDDKYVALGKQMAKLVPTAEFEIISAAGHTVHLEQPEAFCNTVARFLKHRTGSSPLEVITK